MSADNPVVKFAMTWKIGTHLLAPERESVLMGILNVTPDSFSDGGKFNSLDAALAQAARMIANGAAIIDIGGESTRPGSDAVSPAQEQERVIPVIRNLKKHFPDTLLSLDTRNHSTAAAGLGEGVDIINDISGLTSPEMIEVCRQSDCGLIVMHMKGAPKTMQESPQYDDVVEEVSGFFRDRYHDLTSKGIVAERICFDPGIGFGKTTAHNVELIARLTELDTCGCSFMMALSRKRFLSELLGSLEDGRSPNATAVATLVCHQKGVRFHRVHDVKECAEALRLAAYLVG